MVLSKIVTTSNKDVDFFKTSCSWRPSYIFSWFCSQNYKVKNCEFGNETKTCKSPNNFDNVRFVTIVNIHEQLFVNPNIASSNKAIDSMQNLKFEWIDVRLIQVVPPSTTIESVSFPLRSMSSFKGTPTYSV